MAQSEFDDFCRFAFAFLDDRGTRYLVVGGLAVMVVGELRTTADADAVVFVSMAEAEVLIRHAAEAGFEVREDVERQRLASTGTIRLRRGRFQIDLITASLPFEEAASRRASVHELFGRRLPFPSPEDLILFKVLAGRDKDMLDAEAWPVATAADSTCRTWSGRCGQSANSPKTWAPGIARGGCSTW